MGSRGASGSTLGQSKALATPKMQTLTGSDKQISWAEDIRNNAFGTLRNLDRNPDKDVKYTRTDLLEMKKSLISIFSDERAKNAGTIINLRGNFSDQHIRAAVISIHHEGMVWSEKEKKFVRRK